MKLSDIIALAKQGYKPGDIKELIALADDQPDQPDQPDQMETDQPDRPDQPDQMETDQPDQMETDQPDQMETDQQDQLDYKKLYEESLETIKKIQAKNRKDPDKTTPQKTADDIALEHVNDLLKGV